jgi:NAD(P)-dependent dehydrogenase (short-subunit alcohol dehydrogenase family)
MQDPRRVLLTGVTHGIGRAMAREFVNRGHRLAGCGTDARALASLGADLDDGAELFQVDLTDDAAVGTWAERLLPEWGTPDLVINNAGRINRNAPLWEVPPDEFAGVVAVNVNGTYHVIRHFLPAMIEAGAGVVVNMSSGWGRSTAPEVAPYCATKWGIEGLTQALAAELPPGLAAVALNPGVIHTRMLESCFGSSAASYSDPETWARSAVPFLLDLGPGSNGAALTAPG